MWTSEFWGGCGVSSWQHNSHIVHATASVLEGPYAYQDTALSRFSHNPKVVQNHATDAGFYLFHIGDAVPYPPNARCADGAPFCDPKNCNSLCNCSSNSAPPVRNEVWPQMPQSQGANLQNASSVVGPWTSVYTPGKKGPQMGWYYY